MVGVNVPISSLMIELLSIIIYLRYCPLWNMCSITVLSLKRILVSERKNGYLLNRLKPQLLINVRLLSM